MLVNVNVYEVLTHLKESQILAKAWLQKRERERFGESDLLGGMFCDPPGMGKTLTMIAAMQENPGNPFAPTLIIVPPQVISVWVEEFTKRTNIDKSRILIYYGPKRCKHSLNENTLFVISTYAIIRNECIQDYANPGIAYDPDNPCFTEKSIFNYEFYRVILDEAHVAKNYKSKASIALTWLSTHIKWVITATSKINSLDDEYGTFRFLGIFNSWEEWRSIVPSTSSGISAAKMLKLKDMQQYMEALKADIMLCRPKSMLNLPPKTELYIPLEFSKAEKDFYNNLQIYALSRIDALEQTAEAAEFREYSGVFRSSVLKMINRLKMATNNCFFVIQTTERLKHVKTLEKATEILQFYNKKANRSEECIMCQDDCANYISSCNHKFCHKCWLLSFKRQERKSKNETLDSDSDSDDNEDSEDSDDSDSDSDSDSEDKEKSIINECSTKGYGKCPRCKKSVESLEKISTPMHNKLIRTLTKSEEVYVTDNANGYSSPKIAYMKNIIAESINKTKIIVVSQSIVMLDYANKILNELYPGQILRIDGTRSVDARTNDIKTFQDSQSNKKILLFSLTCNPEGITLTKATILIHLDHWWNKNGKVEQINNRIHRISQDFPTTIYYLFMDKTIENKIFQLQDHKYQLVNYDFDNLVDRPRLISE